MILPATVIRPATEADLPAICALGMEVNLLHHDARPDCFAPPADPERDRDYWRLHLLADGSRFFIAELDGQPLGMVTAQIAQETSTLAQPVTYCRIGSISVTAAARGQGLGKQLMAAVDTWAHAEGATEVRLSVWEFNQRAIAFYEELGYTARSRTMSRSLVPDAMSTLAE